MANVGTLDRVVRAVAGVVLLALPFLLAETDAGISAFGITDWVMIVVGVVLLVTAAMRFCPLYRILGLRTCPLSK